MHSDNVQDDDIWARLSKVLIPTKHLFTVLKNY